MKAGMNNLVLMMKVIVSIPPQTIPLVSVLIAALRAYYCNTARCAFIIGTLFCLWNTHQCECLWGTFPPAASYASTLIVLSLLSDGHLSLSVMIGYRWRLGAFCHGDDSRLRRLVMEVNCRRVALHDPKGYTFSPHLLTQYGLLVIPVFGITFFWILKAFLKAFTG